MEPLEPLPKRYLSVEEAQEALPEVRRRLERLQRLHGELADIRGLAFEYVQRGLVDFPSLDGGQEVLLCWMQGEEEVGFFHDLERGFAGRQPVSLLKRDFPPQKEQE